MTTRARGRSRTFGTFLGVYTPSVLTILGLIMYLRFGWVLGNLGLPLTLVVVVLSSAITCITALSASALSTNIRVGVGGDASPVAVQVVAAIIVIVVTTISGRSAAVALKLQLPIMAAVGMSLVALLIGVLGGGFRAPELSADMATAPEGF